MEIPQWVIVAAGFVVNFLGILYAIVNSKVKLEKRLSTLETKVNILMRNADLPHRRSDDDLT